jgi:hypothetical protein
MRSPSWLGEPPHAVDSFKHALVRDAAYNSILKSKRQQIHAHIARALQQRFPDTEPEVRCPTLLRGRAASRIDPLPAQGRAARREAIRSRGSGAAPHQGT